MKDELLTWFVYAVMVLWTAAVYLFIWDVLGVLLSIFVWLMGWMLFGFVTVGFGELISKLFKLFKKGSPDER